VMLLPCQALDVALDVDLHKTCISRLCFKVKLLRPIYLSCTIDFVCSQIIEFEDVFTTVLLCFSKIILRPSSVGMR
jgi:hypothetical protein